MHSVLCGAPVATVHTLPAWCREMSACERTAVSALGPGAWAARVALGRPGQLDTAAQRAVSVCPSVLAGSPSGVSIEPASGRGGCERHLIRPAAAGELSIGLTTASGRTRRSPADRRSAHTHDIQPDYRTAPYVQRSNTYSHDIQPCHRTVQCAGLSRTASAVAR